MSRLRILLKRTARAGIVLFFDILTIIHFWKLEARINKGQRRLCSVVSRLWILLIRTALGVVTSRELATGDRVHVGPFRALATQIGAPCETVLCPGETTLLGGRSEGPRHAFQRAVYSA